MRNILGVVKKDGCRDENQYMNRGTTQNRPYAKSSIRKIGHIKM
jgi:hypothetical protein